MWQKLFPNILVIDSDPILFSFNGLLPLPVRLNALYSEFVGSGFKDHILVFVELFDDACLFLSSFGQLDGQLSLEELFFGLDGGEVAFLVVFYLVDELEASRSQLFRFSIFLYLLELLSL